jgi:trehalose-phosphatase
VDAPSLDDRIAQQARAPQLLVACDYDGTIAPLVDDPMQAHPRRETVVALRALADLPQTNVAVISGRSLRDLATLSRLPPEIHLVGSHGSEYDIGFGRGLDVQVAALRTQIEEMLAHISDDCPGSLIEPKPAAVAFHHRGASDADSAKAIAAIESGPAALDGVHVRKGNNVVELSVITTDKGSALEAIRNQVGASAVVFIGDDVTDEDAFQTLAGPDVGVKVGSGDTVAEFHVDDTVAVSEVLAQLAQLRREWLVGSSAVPIEHHAMLSDQRTAAIVTPDARITWLCAPRIDSAAVFAELVGGPPAGYFSVGPADGDPVSGQRYRDDSLVLETTWPGMSVVDYLDCSGGRPGRLAGRSDLIRVLEGHRRVRIEFAPRLDFGRYGTQLAAHEDGIEVVGASDLMALRGPGLEWHLDQDGIHQTAWTETRLEEGVPLVLELRLGTASLKADTASEADRRASTQRHFGDWALELKVPSTHRTMVRRSAITLKGLCHGPTGAIVAAATTSLPEHIGGIRNWDYRYCWLRDAALSATALVRLGSFDEAMAYLDWVLNIVEERDEPERLAPLYNVTGRHLPPEADLAELAGYAGSRPVRIGNAADRQVQLDVFGPIVELVWTLLDAGAPLSSQHLKLVEQMVAAVEQRWDEPDHGIWEIRKPPRHHVHSKTMCWVTADRAVKIAEGFLGQTKQEWADLRDRIAEDVLEHGYKEEVGAFTAAYDGTDLDASVLTVGLKGLVAPDDPRFAGTVRAVEDELRDGPTVWRYHDDDGLPGTEGGFNLMTSWLIDAYLLVGRVDDARSLFKDLASLAGPTGLMAEEYDPATDRALGNHPQAYSHLGLIENALNLDLA